MNKENNVVKLFPKKKSICPVCLGHGSYKVVGPRVNVFVFEKCYTCSGKGEVWESPNEKPVR